MQHDDTGSDNEEPLHAADAPNPFRMLWDGGYRRLVPIVPPDAELSPHSSLARRPECRGKAVGVKGQHGWHGFNWHVHETTEADLDRWHAMGAGVGLRMGEGLVAIDIDALDPELAAAAAQAAFEILGVAPRRFGRAPKLLLLYRTATDLPYERIEFDGLDGKVERVEALGPGQQGVMVGIHPGTGRSYLWPDGIPVLEDLPEITAEQKQAYFDRLVEIMPNGRRPSAPNNIDRSLVDQQSLAAPAPAVRKAVDAIPNDRSDRAWNIRMAAAIKAAVPDDPDEAFDIYWSWCQRWTVRDKEYDHAWSDFQSIGERRGIGSGYLFALAARHTGVVMTPPELFFAPIEDGEEPDTSAFGIAGISSAPTVTGGNGRPPLRFQTSGECSAGALMEGAAPLIKGLLDQGAMTVFYGESNVGKTFAAMDLAFHVASGLPWAGMKTTQAGVAYVAAEGGVGAKRRVLALVRKYGTCDSFHILQAPVDLLHADADLRPLIEAIRDIGGIGGIGLVVIDTLSRALAGGDENSSTDMGALVRHFDALREAVSAHLLIVHHTGKDRAKGARGHSLLRAATDTEIEISEGQIKVTKQRDLDKAWASPFTLETVTLGTDADGDPITSCTVRLVSCRAELPVRTPTPKESSVLAALQSHTARTKCPAGQNAVAAEMADGTTGKQARYHLRMLEEKRLIVRVGRGKWQPVHLARDPAAFFSEVAPETSTPESGGIRALQNVFD